MNLVDSSGWIEYLLDTERADLFAQAIEHRNDLLVPVIALFEVHKVLSRKMPTELVAKCLLSPVDVEAIPLGIFHPAQII